MSDEKEISRVRSSELARGKQSSAALARKRKRLETLLIGALTRGDREMYAELLNELGQPSGTVEHENSMRIFDEYHATR
ncbi:MAG TPA: hypothetical protein VJX29_09955 [Candidatus Acidoferrales bacterium]|nr:hypothetical protein [Candidatus Acidoferrales bacterium]